MSKYVQFQAQATGAYFWQMSIIVAKSGFKDALPTRKPSIFGYKIKSDAFLALTDPPY